MSNPSQPGRKRGSLPPGPPAHSGIPPAVLLAARRELPRHAAPKAGMTRTPAKEGRSPPNPAAQFPKFVEFEDAIYPATMGPDVSVDRMGYGELVDEKRSTSREEIKARKILRTRSGSVPVVPGRLHLGPKGAGRAP